MAAEQCLDGSPESKALRQEFSDAALRVTVLAQIKHNRLWAKLVNHLTASATRRAWHVLSVRYSDRHNLKRRTFRSDRRKNRCPLRAIRHSIRRIFNIAARKNISLGSKNRRAHLEV